MENNGVHFRMTESKDAVGHELELGPNEVDTHNVVGNSNLESTPESLREMVNSLQLQDSPASMQELTKSYQLVVATLMAAIKSLEELKIDVTDIRKSSDIIQTSVKTMEVVVCTSDDTSKNKSVTQKKQGSLNPVAATMGTARNDTPCNSNDARNKRKMVEDETLQLFNNDFLTLSDDDNEDATKKLCLSNPTTKVGELTTNIKPQIPSSWTQSRSSAKFNEVMTREVMLGSDHRRVKTTETNVADPSSLALTRLAKRLFQTPSPSTSSKHVQGNPQVELILSGSKSPNKKYGSNAKGKLKVTQKRHGHNKEPGTFVPKDTKLKFHPTNNMQLDFHELQVIAYVYAYQKDLPSMDDKEVLVISGDLFAHRDDIESLCPGRQVKTEIISLAAEKTRWCQKNLETNLVWSLPPSFEEDVFNGYTLYDLTDIYRSKWMEPYPNLKYIYVPIKTTTNHWYLMVISLQNKAIYHLDSYLPEDDVAPRRQRMTILGEVLSQMALAPHYGTTFMDRDLAFQEWDIKEVRGVPNCGRSVNSGVWLLEWLEMEHDFTPNVSGKLLENQVRMRTAATILLGCHNELRNELMEKAAKHWETLPHYEDV